MPIACFQLLMSENYCFTKTKDCLRTGVVVTSFTLDNFHKIDSYSNNTPKVGYTYSVNMKVVRRGVDRLVTPLGTLREFIL